mgnify:CR=1 FL=1
MNQEIKLPPLPETEYLLGIPARPYESEWISSDSAWDDSAMQAYATAAVELDRAQRGEPVAWIWRFPDGGLHETPFGTLAECERDAIGYDGSAVPLYTAPQPSQPKRKPMPDNEMNDLAFQCGIQREDARDPGIEEFARAIEAFHGIKP